MLDSTFLKKLENLSLVSHRIFPGQLLAHRHARQKGNGIVFANHRKYQFGDDLRYLDWNAYARSGNELIRQFEEEKDLHIYLLLDCSQSMAWGNPNKFDYARQVIAALAYVALADLDRVSIVAFADKIVQIFPSIRGKQHILNVIRFLDALKTVGNTTDIATSMDEFVCRKLHTGLAVIMSDFYDPNGFKQGLDILRHQNFEPHIIQIHDDREASPVLRGDIRLCDAESGSLCDVAVSGSMIRRYKQKFLCFLDEIKHYGIDNGINYTLTSTSTPFDEMILRMLKERQEAIG